MNAQTGAPGWIHQRGEVSLKKEVKFLAVRCLAPHGDWRTKLQKANTYTYLRLNPLLVTQNYALDVSALCNQYFYPRESCKYVLDRGK